jgi:hypothetical protein
MFEMKAKLFFATVICYLFGYVSYSYAIEVLNQEIEVNEAGEAETRLLQSSCLLQQSIIDIYGRNSIGIFAGGDFKIGDTIEHCPFATLPIDNIKSNVLDEYAMGHNESHISLIFGYSMIYNTNPIRTVGTYSDDDNDTRSILMIVEQNIKKGDEIFFYYGADWFPSRGLEPYIPDPSKAPVARYDVPGCPQQLTYLHYEYEDDILPSSVYAEVFIPKGTVIEVARTLIVPKYAWEHSEITSLIWVTHKMSLGLLNLGWGAFYRSDKLNANVKHSQWFVPRDALSSDSSGVNKIAAHHQEQKVSATGEERAEDTEEKCVDKLFVQFVAMNDIYPDQELIVDLEQVDYVFEHSTDDSRANLDEEHGQYGESESSQSRELKYTDRFPCVAISKHDETFSE